MARRIDFGVETRTVAGAFSLRFLFYVRSFGIPYATESERPL